MYTKTKKITTIHIEEMNLIKSLSNTYKKMSNWGKVLILVVVFLIVYMLFKSMNERKEGFSVTTDEFTFKDGKSQVYDDFYVNIYDQLLYNNVKNDYEIKQIVNNTKPDERSVILDIGSGTGHHVAALADQNFKVTGVDKSQDMVNKAKESYPNLNFMQGDVMNALTFQPQSFTHILCLYFTIYYMPDKLQFFRNCMNWLMGGGYLVIHLVDKYMFDTIIPPANPLLLLTPQRYAENRITTSKVSFDNFQYAANFELNDSNNSAKFVESFKNKKSGKVFRKQEHELYMEPYKEILAMAKDAGFIVQGKIDLLQSGYEYQYLFVLVKPN
jgi:SAM-dependent methyltransferase